MQKIIELVNELLKDFLASNDLELYNVEYVKEGSDYYLRVYIDKVWVSEDEEIEIEGDSEGIGEWSSRYVSTDDCEKVSEFLSKKLDELDPIPENYYLEVSSPGLDRELIRPQHFKKFEGELVDVFLKNPSSLEDFRGAEVIEGTLVGLIDDEVVIKVTIDTKKANRKPGAKVGKSALATKELRFKREEFKKVQLAFIF